MFGYRGVGPNFFQPPHRTACVICALWRISASLLPLLPVMDRKYADRFTTSRLSLGFLASCFSGRFIVVIFVLESFIYRQTTIGADYRKGVKIADDQIRINIVLWKFTKKKKEDRAMLTMIYKIYVNKAITIDLMFSIFLIGIFLEYNTAKKKKSIYERKQYFNFRLNTSNEFWSWFW